MENTESTVKIMLNSNTSTSKDTEERKIQWGAIYVQTKTIYINVEKNHWNKLRQWFTNGNGSIIKNKDGWKQAMKEIDSFEAMLGNLLSASETIVDCKWVF